MKHLVIFLILIPLIMTGQNKQEIEHLSLLTTPIILKKGAKELSQGTGFFFVKDNVLYLVSNYHVITGSAPDKGKDPIGDSIEFYFHKDKFNPKNVKKVTYPLLTKSGLQVWKSSTEYKNADVSVILIPPYLYDGCQVSAITEKWAEAQIKVRPTSPLTLVGYPYGYYDKHNSLPIWKTGSIASEPHVDFEDKPLFVIDISAFPGMSGAPAFVVVNGAYEMEQGGTTVGQVRKFMGIYASMQMLSEKRYLELLPSNTKKPGIINTESLELGHVWKASLIFNIINNIDINEYEKTILSDI